MRINRYTDYALRALIYTGLNPNRPCTIREIAARYDISKNHLMKVVQDLVARGYLDATRGRNGGVRLGRPAETINVGQLVRELETEGPVDCFREDGRCVISPACQLKHALAQARDAFFKALDGYTLADLLPSESRVLLLGLLGDEAGIAEA